MYGTSMNEGAAGSTIRGRARRAASVGAVCAALLALVGASSAAAEAFEAFYRFDSVHPDRVAANWARDAQGITTDGTSWYLTQTDALWKVPVTTDLAGDLPPGTPARRLRDVPELAASGLDHFGDPSWIDRQGGEALVLVPVESSRDANVRPLRLAAFRARDLAFLGSAPLPCTRTATECGGAGQHGFGWLAVAPDGTLVSSSSHGSVLHTYRMSWELSREAGSTFALEVDRRIPLRDEHSRSLELHHLQGGAFSPSGERLYLVTGWLAGGCAPFANTKLDGDEMRSSGGVHVFDAATGHRIRHSTNGNGLFTYRFDPTLPTCQEPEGLTIWNFGRQGRAPGFEGTLHVLRVDHGLFRDAISIHHYDGVVHVREGAPPGGNGRRTRPYSLLVDALAQAWPGARIEWVPGRAPTTMTLPLAMPVTGGAVWVSRPPERAPAAVSSRPPSGPGVPRARPAR